MVRPREERTMKVWVTMAGRDAEVTFRTEGGQLMVEYGGKEFHADVVKLPDGEVYSLLVNGRSYEVRVAQEQGALGVTWSGTAMSVEVKHPLEKMLQQVAGAKRHRGETIMAPMPGAVVTIRVQVGDSVVPGQSVLVLEAMKMQNELAAQTAGVVREILVAEKAAVSAGTPLIKIAPHAEEA